ncbi:uncharacterized protein LOC106165825 [Lingula anatina]|uniref:Uncharacterized protein LOC106165825 n=1 Tax=Lingula anatina TaxID=7574 RepID=A0A1S3IN21_LINAN|nr:uncharacterized protein LOC106165825 [Lingula anatina]|eukprot:XP_013399635.1 uncharacterized protein LOC106165825 [Lingula anatina]
MFPMGCSSSNSAKVAEHEKNSKVPDKLIEEKQSKLKAEEEVAARTLRGDLYQKESARKAREKKLQEKRKKTAFNAEVMSDRVMEEKERLSWVSSRSRATSRAGSPPEKKKHVTFPDQVKFSGPGSCRISPLAQSIDVDKNVPDDRSDTTDTASSVADGQVTCIIRVDDTTQSSHQIQNTKKRNQTLSERTEKLKDENSNDSFVQINGSLGHKKLPPILRGEMKDGATIHSNYRHDKVLTHSGQRKDAEQELSNLSTVEE